MKELKAENLTEQAYKTGMTWWVYYLDEKGNQVADAGLGRYKKSAREQAQSNLKTPYC